MTKQEWLDCSYPLLMLVSLRHSSRRKLRLFGVACCHRIQHLLPDTLSHDLIDAAEQFADGRVSEEGMAQLTAHRRLVGVGPLQFTGDEKAGRSARDAVWHVSLVRKAERCFGPFALQTARYAASAVAWHLVGIARSATVAEGWAAAWNAAESDEFCEQANILRDIFGNPFRPVVVNPVWLTPAVVELARTIYEGRRFDRLTVLADDLERAGCDNADILNHCRQPVEHVRGCWLIDALLGKS